MAIDLRQYIREREPQSGLNLQSYIKERPRPHSSTASATGRGIKKQLGEFKSGLKSVFIDMPLAVGDKIRGGLEGTAGAAGKAIASNVAYARGDKDRQRQLLEEAGEDVRGLGRSAVEAGKAVGRGVVKAPLVSANVGRKIGGGPGNLIYGAVEGIGAAASMAGHKAGGYDEKIVEDWNRLARAVSKQKEGLVDTAEVTSYALALGGPNFINQFGSGVLRNLAAAVESGEDPRSVVSEAATAGLLQAGGVKLMDKIIGKITGKKKEVKPKTEKQVKVAEKIVDKKIDQNYNQAFKPRKPKSTGEASRNAASQRRAVKVIAKHKDQLQLGDDLHSGLPRNQAEHLQAVEQTKDLIYQKYAAAKAKAGGDVVRIDLKPLAQQLDDLADDVVLQTNRPEMVKMLHTRANALRSAGAGQIDDALIGTYTLDQADDAIKMMNKDLSNFYRNPSYDSATKAAIEAKMSHYLRENLDDMITKETGVHYQALKNDYGALKAIENDALKAMSSAAKKGPKGLVDMTDIFISGDLGKALVTMEPALFAKASFGKAMQSYIKFMNSPQRMIKTMYKDVDKFIGAHPSPEIFTVAYEGQRALPVGASGAPQVQVNQPIPLAAPGAPVTRAGGALQPQQGIVAGAASSADDLAARAAESTLGMQSAYGTAAFTKTGFLKNAFVKQMLNDFQLKTGRNLMRLASSRYKSYEDLYQAIISAL